MADKPPRFDRSIYEARVRELLEVLDIPFISLEKYCQAFVHRSILNERSTPFRESNERLEFLGDAVLELISTELLYHHFPEKPEGQLTDIRSALVQGARLAEVATDLGFSDYLLLSRGEVSTGGNKNPYLLANAFEAFLGAIYLDLGYTQAHTFVEIHVFSRLNDVLARALHVDPKSSLQEYTQAHLATAPTYVVLEESGLDHEKTYTIGVYVRGTEIGRGTGSNKKKAEKLAAEAALQGKAEWKNSISSSESV